MAYTYTYRDGERVQVDVATAFDRLAAAFRNAWGLDLLVTSGTRTNAEQWELYRQYLNGGTLAAYPGTSNHEEGGPRGPRALDVRDSGGDPGVTRYGTPRANWLRANAPAYGFDPAGYGFSQTEPWHIEYTGNLDGSGGGGNFPANARYGADWVKAIQDKLNRLGYGPLDVDGLDGASTQSAVRSFQSSVGLDADGIAGPDTNARLDSALSGGGKLNVDGQWGAATTRALQKVLGVTVDGEIGPNTIKALQTKLGVTADGEIGPNTTRALQNLLKVNADGEIGPATVSALQTYLNNGGNFSNVTPPTPDPGTDWSKNNPAGRNVADIQRVVGANPDGQWGPDTDAKIKAWQASKGLEADGIWGGTSDGTAFPPAGSTPGMDYSFARPDPKKIFDAGFRHVGRYLWKPKYDDGRTNKGLSKEEYDALTKAGLKVWLIYEEDGHELTGGYDAGVRVAKAAEEYRKALGLGELPIYFNVDYDAPDADLVNILKALDGIASVIGLNRTGLYAGYGPIKAAFDAKKITWGFQTYAWSGGKWDTRAQLQQWSNGQWGDSVDFTRAMVAEYGQNPVKVTPTPDPKPEPDVWKIEIPKSEAVAAGKFLDQVIGYLTQLRRLFP